MEKEEFFSLESETDRLTKNFKTMGREELLSFLNIPLDPEALVSYHQCEAALMAAEVILRSSGKKAFPLPHEIQVYLPEKSFQFTRMELQKARQAVIKTGEKGSEFEFDMEHEGAEHYNQFRMALTRLTEGLLKLEQSL